MTSRYSRSAIFKSETNMDTGKPASNSAIRIAREFLMRSFFNGLVLDSPNSFVHLKNIWFSADWSYRTAIPRNQSVRSLLAICGVPDSSKSTVTSMVSISNPHFFRIPPFSLCIGFPKGIRAHALTWLSPDSRFSHYDFRNIWAQCLLAAQFYLEISNRSS